MDKTNTDSNMTIQYSMTIFEDKTDKKGEHKKYDDVYDDLIEDHNVCCVLCGCSIASLSLSSGIYVFIVCSTVLSLIATIDSRYIIDYK